MIDLTAIRAAWPHLTAAALLAVSAPALAQTSTTGPSPSSPGVLNGLSDTAKDAGQKPADAAAPSNSVPAPAAVPATPVVDAVRSLLSDKAFAAKANGDDVAALKDFYAARSDALWVKDGAFTDKANAVVTTLKQADDWGLEASAFDVTPIASGASNAAQGEAETRLSYAALKYARHARGGRVQPLSLSNILDMTPPVKDPKVVLTGLEQSASPATYLTGLNPKHPEFEKLRQALLKARGPHQLEEKIDDALKVKIPAEGKTLKRGVEHEDVVLLRKRLKLELSENANNRYFDDQLEAALKAFQVDKGIKANGQLTEKTRSALNREAEPQKADPKRELDRLIVNMERWRWLPEDLGSFYVMNNIPEFVSRIMKNGNEALKQKIVAGQPTWPTPVLSAKMEFVIFHPEWGVPDGIKVKELLPRLKRASGYDGGFFDQLFSGGSSGGARVLAAYKLQPTLNGRPVDANSINWNNVDIRRFSFTQPAGGENPLGNVKFRFPNRHDVYMHDTPQKALFAQSFRALSHGCMRLENPRRTAELILAEDKGWSADKVGAQYDGGTNEIALEKPVPVYLTYFTARVDEDGKLQRYSDIYGHDERLMSALQGRAVRYSAPEEGRDDVVAAQDGANSGYDYSEPAKKGKKQAGKYKKESQTVGDLLMDALSNF